jgi:hypothetical protein
MAAIVHLSKLAWSRQDQGLLGQLMGRVGELERTGHPTAHALSTVAGAAIADLIGDDEQLLGLLDDIEPSALDRTWGTLVSFWTAQVRMGLGDTAPIHDLLDRLGPATDPALRGVASAVELSVMWAEGGIDAALDRCPDMLATIRTAGVRSHLYLALNGACLAAARVGDLDLAHRYLDESVAVALPSAAGEGVESARTMMARANLRIAEGDEGAAAAILREAITIHGLAQGADRDTWRQHIPVTYVLLPEAREHWDTALLRGHLLVARTLAHAVVALRAGRTEHLSLLDLPSPGMVRSALDARWVTELAVGLHDVGRRNEARTLLDDQGPAGWPTPAAGAAGRTPGPARPRRCSPRRRPRRPSRPTWPCSARWSCGGAAVGMGSRTSASRCSTPTCGASACGPCSPSWSATAAPPAPRSWAPSGPSCPSGRRPTTWRSRSATCCGCSSRGATPASPPT